LLVRPEDLQIVDGDDRLAGTVTGVTFQGDGDRRRAPRRARHPRQHLVAPTPTRSPRGPVRSPSTVHEPSSGLTADVIGDPVAPEPVDADA
jgi:hypothetical protein